MSSGQTADASNGTTDAGTEALGARGNWWGDDGSGEDIEGHEELPGVGREEWVAGKLLRGPDATLYCPECWNDRDRAVELSDPVCHVPPSEVKIVLDEVDGGEFVSITVPVYTDHRRHRHCTASGCGYVSWGGILADRPMAEFLEIVEGVLVEANLPSSQRVAILAAAQSRKAGGQRDETNMERVLYEIAWGPDE